MRPRSSIASLTLVALAVCSCGDKATRDAGESEAAVAADPTMLLDAVYREKESVVSELIAGGHSVNVANDLGATPLWLACASGNAAIAGQLLAAGADANATLLRGESALHAAARTGNAELVGLLIDAGARLEATSTRGQTALMWAAARGHTDVIRKLIKAGADVHAKSQLIDSHVAVDPHYLRELRRVIKRGGLTPLLFAVRNGHVEAARVLLDGGADVHAKNGWGVTALGYASFTGNTEMIRLLLERGADPNNQDAGFTPLHAVLMRRNHEAMMLLLERGADVNAKVKTWTHSRRKSLDEHFPPALIGATPIWLAAHTQQAEAVRELARRGADAKFIHRIRFPTESLKVREHALTVAMAPVWAAWELPIVPWVYLPVEKLRPLAFETVKAAAEVGADLHGTDLKGRTVLNAARRTGNKELVAYLVARGVAELK